MSEVPKEGKKRSVSLSPKLNSDLITLTDALGINAHSYMVNEIAKAVQRDSLSLQINNNSNGHMAAMLDMVKSKLSED